MSMPVTKYILVSKNIFPLILFTFNSVSVNLIILNLCTLLKSIWKWLFFYYRWGCISSPSNLFSSFMKETASILVSPTELLGWAIGRLWSLTPTVGCLSAGEWIHFLSNPLPEIETKPSICSTVGGCRNNGLCWGVLLSFCDEFGVQYDDLRSTPYDESVWRLLRNVPVKPLEFSVGNLFGSAWLWALSIPKSVLTVFWVAKNEDVSERPILGPVSMVITGVLSWIRYLDVFNI